MVTSAERTIRFAVRGPIERTDLPDLSDRVCALLSGSPGSLVYCDVAGVEPDAVTVDALARLRLAAARQNCHLRLCNASADLLDLLVLMGLDGTLSE